MAHNRILASSNVGTKSWIAYFAALLPRHPLLAIASCTAWGTTLNALRDSVIQYMDIYCRFTWLTQSCLGVHALFSRPGAFDVPVLGYTTSWQVFGAMANASESPQGDNSAAFLNMTASLAIVCCLLCIYSAYGVGAREVDVMAQVCSKVVQWVF